MPKRSRTPEPESRRWHVPPPLVRGSAALEGSGILEEIPGEQGILLWQSLRTVTLWASAPSESRAKLFLPEAHERRMADLQAASPDPELAGPLGTIADLLSRPEAEADKIGAACTRVAEWALEHDAPATAFDFAQTAALASPADPKLGLMVARMARDRAEYPAAEAWYQRTIGLARQAGDWDSYARAYIGLGKAASTRGAYPAARKAFLKAYRAASRRSLHEPEGMALHDLLVVETEAGRFDKALEFGGLALRAYGPGHPLLPGLAHDVAYIWMQQGQFAAALPVLRAAVPRMLREQQVHGQANIARAAGAVGDERTFRRAWKALNAVRDTHPGKAGALVEAARGAASLGRWDDAESAAGRALELARERGQGKVTFDAEAVLDSVRAERAADTTREASTAKRGSREPADPLARDLVRFLESNEPNGTAGAR